MANSFPRTLVTSGTEADTLLTNAMGAAGMTDPTGGLSLTDKLAWAVAELLRNGGAGSSISVTNDITAFATGGQASAVLLTLPVNRITVCATAGDSVRLPTALAGATVTVINDGAAACDVYPVSAATGDVINAYLPNIPLRIAAGSRVTFQCAVTGTWSSTATGLPYAKFTTDAAGTATVPAGLLTGAAFVSARNTANGAVAWTCRTATQMFADTPNARVGDSYMLLITSAGDNTVTLTTATGVTLTGTMTIATATTRLFVVTFTSATALVIQSVSIGSIA